MLKIFQIIFLFIFITILLIYKFCVNKTKNEKMYEIYDFIINSPLSQKCDALDSSLINDISLNKISPIQLSNFLKNCGLNDPPDKITCSSINVSSLEAIIKNICLIVNKDSLLDSIGFYWIKLKPLDGMNGIELCKEDYFKNLYAIPSTWYSSTGIAINDSTVITHDHYNPKDVFVFNDYIDWNNAEPKIIRINKNNVYCYKERYSARTQDQEQIGKIITRTKIKNIINIEIANKIDTTIVVYSLGYPLGTSLRFHKNSKLTHKESNYNFFTTLNVYQNNSGSPVFDSMTNKLVGIITNAPYRQMIVDKRDCCFRSRNTCRELGLSTMVSIELIYHLKKIDEKDY
jgi:hypothetical protein